MHRYCNIELSDIIFAYGNAYGNASLAASIYQERIFNFPMLTQDANLGIDRGAVTSRGRGSYFQNSVTEAGGHSFKMSGPGADFFKKPGQGGDF